MGGEGVKLDRGSARAPSGGGGLSQQGSGSISGTGKDGGQSPPEKSPALRASPIEPIGSRAKSALRRGSRRGSVERAQENFRADCGCQPDL